MRVGIPSKREPVSLWQIVIPADKDRGEYLEHCFNTNTVSISSRYGEILHDVPIPNNALQEIDWPELGGFGSEVVVGNVTGDGTQYPVVLNVIRTKTKFEHNKENTYRWKKGTDNSKAEVLIRGKEGYVVLSVDSAEENGGKIILNITNSENSGELDVNVNGAANISAGNISLQAGEEIRETLFKNKSVNEDEFQTEIVKTINGFEMNMTKGEDVVNTIKFTTDEGFTYTDQFENSVSITEEQIDIVSAGEVVNLGEGTEKMVLGDTLAQLLKDLIQEISIATTPAGPLGNAAAIAAYIQQVDNILSEYSNTQ